MAGQLPTSHDYPESDGNSHERPSLIPPPRVPGGSKDSTVAIPRTGPTTEAVQQIFARTSRFLGAVEQRIEARLESEAPALTEIARYLLQQGGKRVRPIFCLLAGARFLADAVVLDQNSKPTPIIDPAALPTELIQVAAGIELIHMATLLHDDIIDEAAIRRNRRSAFAEFGLPASLLTGDFLLVRAFGLCAELDSFVIAETEAACVALTEGEILEGNLSAACSQNIEGYLDVVRRKTASLFALATTTGAHIAGASAEDVAKMRRFGEHAGIAFQMIDDILDVIADESLLGKPAGADLRQKAPSLVNILWVESGDARAQEWLTTEVVVADEVEAIRAHLRNHPVLDDARQRATQQRNLAAAALTAIDSPKTDGGAATSDLLTILDYTLQRCL